MPFKYGIATMTAFPLCFVVIECEIDGKITTGIASDLLPPKWFKKDPNQDPVTELKELQSVIRNACKLSINQEASSIFECWSQIYHDQTSWGNELGLPSLLVHFGTSLIERALIDSLCRHVKTPFHIALQENQFGIRYEDLNANLTTNNQKDFLPKHPLNQVIARHTIGLSDPLTNGDIPENEQLTDGLPQSLEECIKAYGLKHFKIKVCGDLKTDAERLENVAKVISSSAINDYAFTLDGNEQFNDLLAFKDFWREIRNQSKLKSMFSRLMFVEQPLHRDVAMRENITEAMHQWKDRPPIIIDESDGDLDSASKAIKLGYDGTSHKNCKGVFKSVGNYLMIHQHNKNSPARPCIQSGEDLCNQGPVAIMQDLCVAASLGIHSVERNGHHYCAGLSAHPDSVKKQVVDHHPDVYAPSIKGWPSIVINNGCISARSINKSPFGIQFIPNLIEYENQMS